MTIDPKDTNRQVDDAWEAYREACRERFNPAEVRRERAAVEAAVRTAHLQELAGETEQETMEKAVRGAVRKAQEIALGSPYGGIDLFYARLVPAIAPILRAPLLAQLREQEARIKELEGKLDNERQAHSKSLHLVGDTMERVCKLGKRVESREEGNWGTRVVVTRQGDLYMMRDEVYRALQWPIPEVSSFHAEVP